MSTSSTSSSSSQPSRGLSLYSGNQEQKGGGLSFSSSSSQSSGGLSLYSKGQGSVQRGLSLSLRDEQGRLSLASGGKLNGDILIARELEEGALSLGRDEESLKMINRIAMASIDQMIEMHKEIDDAIRTFIEDTKKHNRQFSQVALKLSMDIVEGKCPEQRQADNVIFVGELAKQVGDRHFEAAKQLMELRKLSHEGKLTDLTGVIELIFVAKFKEIELLSKRAEILRSQDDHKLKVMVALHNQELKAEAQLFDQYMQKAKFDSAEDQRQFENSLATREQTRKEEKDLQEMAMAEVRLNKEFDLETLKAENRKEIEMYATTSNEKIEKARISSQERVAYAQVAASRTRCIIL